MVKYTVHLNGNCPEYGNCIGFSHPVQTESGVISCTNIYKCPYAQENMWKRKAYNNTKTKNPAKI